MEQQRKRPRRRRKQEADLRPAEPDVLRCPYCRGELPSGALAGCCEQCQTLHHVACFAEHRGCSTHGCGSARAVALRVGSPIPLDFPRLRCAQCRTSPEQDALVARCACGRVLDVPCYEALGSCGAPSCQRPVRLLTHLEAAAEQARASARGLWPIAAVLLALAPASLFLVPPPTGAHAFALLLVFGFTFGALSLGPLLRARRLARLPRATPRRPEPAKPDEPPPAAPSDEPPFVPPLFFG